jgi:CRISPR/Cas system-associated exonuclease Cas4 (RecB family)
MNCSLQAKFQYEDELPRVQNAKASFGTVIHKVLESYNHVGDLDAAIDEFKYYWANPEVLGVRPDVWPRMNTYEGLKDKGIDILKAYDDKLRWTERTVIATEHKFEVVMGDHHLSGVVDLLELVKAKNGRRTLRVVDYKTNSKQPNFDGLRLDIQFTSYLYASLQPEFWLGGSEDKYPPMANGQVLYDSLIGVPRKAIWYHLWTNKEIDAGPRDDGDFERLYRLMKEIERAIELGVYIPSINPDSCTFCSYVDKCRYVIPVRKQIELEEQQELDSLF